MDELTQWMSSLSEFLLSSVLPSLFIALVGAVIIRVVLQLVDKTLERTRLDKAAHKLIRSVVRAVCWGLLVLIVASKLGVDVTGIVALASVLTLAISLSVQNTLTNLISGFTLLYTRPFVSGDFVEIAGQSGTVREIGLTYTKLATGDNKSVSIPNGAVTSAQIVNYTVLGKRRIDINVTTAYAAPVEQVLEALREAGAVDTALEDPAPFAAIASYGDSGINYMLQVWSTAADYGVTKFAVNKRIKVELDARGIQLTYPHLNVHLDKTYNA